jgi:hypothetical protein
MKWLVAVMVMLVLAWCAVAGQPPGEEKLKLEFDELAAKATAGIETVNGMEQRAKAEGHTLHPNLIAQRILVQTAMESAQESLRAGDLTKLQSRLKSARASIERLYSMF